MSNCIRYMQIRLPEDLSTDSYGIPLQVGDAVQVKLDGVRRRVVSRVVRKPDGTRGLEGIPRWRSMRVFALIRRDEIVRRWYAAGVDPTTYRRVILARYRDYQTRRLEARHGD